VVLAGVQCRPGTTTKRLFADKQTNKQTAMAPASGRGRSDDTCRQSGDDPTIKIKPDLVIT
jgi:hypothetical protein